MFNTLNIFRQTLRSLTRAPFFTLAAILTLALGLSGALALATVVHGVLLKPLPYPEAHRLAALTSTYLGTRWDILGEVDAEDLQRDSAAFQDLAVFKGQPSVEVEGGGQTQMFSPLLCDGNLPSILGAKAHLGRLFQPEDGFDTLLLSFQGFQKLGGDSNLIGKSIRLEGQPRKIIGVLAKNFRVPDPGAQPDFLEKLDRSKGIRGSRAFRAILKLKPGMRLEQTQTELASKSVALEKAFPGNNKGWAFGAEDLQAHLVGDRSKAMLLSLGVAALLLLIACINVAHLFLVRNLKQRHERTLRMALGASPWSLFQKALAEGLCVGLPAAALGLALAALSLKHMSLLLPDLPEIASLRPDIGEVLLALLLALGTSLFFAIVPFKTAQHSNLASALQGAHTSTGGDKKIRHMLVMAESALAVLILSVSGLLMASFLRAQHRHPGYEIKNRITFTLSLPTHRFPQASARKILQANLKTSLEEVPGIEGVTLCTSLPSGRGDGMSTNANPFPRQKGDPELPSVHFVGVDPGFFKTMNMTIYQGQTFSSEHGPQSAIISQQCAHQMFPGRSPIGRRIQTSLELGDTDFQPEVVGVCSDVIAGDPRGHAKPQVYFNLQHFPHPNLQIIVQSQKSPQALRSMLEARIKALNPHLVIQDLDTLQNVTLAGLSDLRQTSLLLGIFGGLGLLLGLVGVGSVVATQVAQSTREIGIRMSLGARSIDVLRLFMGSALRHVLLGAAVGAILATLLGRVLASQLYDTAPTDPKVFALAILLYTLAAALASFIPARRATHVQPVEAMRGE